MKLIGLTGGVGMGKSTAGELLRKMGLPVIDTDAIARQLVQPGQAALREIHETFGAAVLQADGTLSRQALARIVFSNPQARGKLENILHPRIRAAWQAQAQEWKGQGFQIGVVIIPLLFETRAEKIFDVTLCVACSNETQALRLKQRGWDSGEITRRIQSQWSIDRKITLSDCVIWTDVPLEAHAEQLELAVATSRL